MNWALWEFLRKEFSAIGAPQEAQWVLDSLASDEDCVAQEKAESILSQRKKGVPLAYILGKWSFRDHEFYVGPGVLIPRPETEEIIDYALEASPEKKKRVLDLGAGTGVLGITFALEYQREDNSELDLFLVERSSEAFRYLQKNVEKHLKTLPNVRVSEVNADWKTLELLNIGKFDLILSNPPYVSDEEFAALDPSVLQYEPKEALVPEGGAWAAYTEIFNLLETHLAPNGRAFIEFGTAQEQGWELYIPSKFRFRTYKDLSGRARILEVFDSAQKES